MKQLLVYYLTTTYIELSANTDEIKDLFQRIEVTDLMKLSFYKFHKFRTLVDGIHFGNLLWLN